MKTVYMIRLTYRGGNVMFHPKVYHTKPMAERATSASNSRLSYDIASGLVEKAEVVTLQEKAE